MLDIGRHIGGTDDEQTHVILGGRDDQLAALVRILGRLDARGSEQWQRVIENAAFGQGDGEHGAFSLNGNGQP